MSCQEEQNGAEKTRKEALRDHVIVAIIVITCNIIIVNVTIIVIISLPHHYSYHLLHQHRHNHICYYQLTLYERCNYVDSRPP